MVAAITTAMSVTANIIAITKNAQAIKKRRKNTQREEKSSAECLSNSDYFFLSKHLVTEFAYTTQDQRFQIKSKSERNKWELPGEIADNESHHFKFFITKKDMV